jgi:hypothetical protein
MFRLTRMKLDRAKQRMKELEEALQSFYATNPFKFSGKADLQAGKVVYTMDSVKDAPDEASLIAGEIIQNLRSALDHLAYQLFLRAGGTGAGKNISHWWKQNLVREQEKQPDLWHDAISGRGNRCS